MLTSYFIAFVVSMTAGALLLVFLALLVFYRRLRGSLRTRTAELAEISARLRAEMESRTRVNRDLAESESRFRQMVESLPIGVLICGPNGLLSYANAAAARMLCTAADELVGRHYSSLGERGEISRPKGLPLEPDRGPFSRVLQTGRPIASSGFVIHRPSGETVHLAVNAEPLRSTRGELQGVIACLQDVSDLAQTQAELEIQKRFFEQMFLQSSVATQIFDRSGGRLRANSEWCRLFDVEEEQIASLPYNIFEDRAIIRAGLCPAIRRVIEEGITAEWEVLLEVEGPPEPRMGWFRLRAYPIWSDTGKTTNLVVHYEDIGARKHAEEEMAKSLREKVVLLKEVHHRVKNNMQLMKSMLNLQAGYVHDPRTLSMFTDSASRISTMALIHEKLYQSEQFGSVDIRDYLTYIADSLYQTYLTSDKAVEIKLALEQAVVDIDTAIPCGLLANELISNAMKHAFAERNAGKIELTFHAASGDSSKEQGGCRYELRVRDDGCGLPPGLDWEKNESLGLKLVTSLVQQLDGRITVDSAPDSGTCISVRFPRPAVTALPAAGVEER